MGRPKLLLPYRGNTVLGALLAALRDGGASPLVVVTAPDNAPLRAWCLAAGAQDSDTSPPAADIGGALRLALNPAPESGMLSSILAGLATLGGAADLARRGIPLLIAPGDLPALQAATVAHLIQTARSAAALLAVPIHHGKRGHPLWIAPELLPAVPHLDPNRGLRHLLDLHPQSLLEVVTDDPGCLTDLDTPEDYERLSTGIPLP